MKVAPSPHVPSSRSYEKVAPLVQVPKRGDDDVLPSSPAPSLVLTSSNSAKRVVSSSFTFPDGCTYSGGRKNGVPHGRGISTWPNGDMQYKGTFQNGTFHGHGMFQKHGYTYQGDFYEGNRHGAGVATFPDNSSYSGTFVNNQRHGKGVFTYANGDEYDGDWKENKKHGLGTYTWASGRRYIGIWKEDLNHGVGIETDASGNLVDAGWFKDDDSLSRSKLAKIPFEDSCYICNDKHATGQVLHGTECDHLFHRRCLGRWLEQEETCPICRTGLSPSL